MPTMDVSLRSLLLHAILLILGTRLGSSLQFANDRRAGQPPYQPFEELRRGPPVGSRQEYRPQYSFQDILQIVFADTNMQRRRHNAPQLQYNTQLAKAAQSHAEDMAENNYFSHTGRNGSDLSQRVLTTTNYRYHRVGENLYSQWPSNEPSKAVIGWMNSPGHRENLLNPTFQEIGLGYAQSPWDEKHYYVQVFGKPVHGGHIEGEQDTRRVLLDLTNQARSQYTNLPPLLNSQQLNAAAQHHALEMARTRRLSENGLQNKLRSSGYDYMTFAAEFALHAPFNDPEGVVRQWSKGQKQFMFDTVFSEVGYGYATVPAANGQNQHYYVQLLGTPASSNHMDFTQPSLLWNQQNYPTHPYPQ